MGENVEGAQAIERLAFVDMKEFDDSIRGGILVTDSATTPLEFRCTSAITPTSLQKVLYGRQLKEHIASELIGKPVVSALRERPSLLVARDRAFLSLRAKIDLPLVAVFSQGSAADGGLDDEDVRTGTITSAAGSFEPVIMKPHPRFREDAEKARALIGQLLIRHSIVELFERVATALGLVHRHDKGK